MSRLTNGTTPFSIWSHEEAEDVQYKQSQHKKPGDAHAEQDPIRRGASVALDPRLVVDH